MWGDHLAFPMPPHPEIPRLYIGTPWVTLHRDFAAFIHQERAREGRGVWATERLLRSFIQPDETLFQTLARISAFRHNTTFRGHLTRFANRSLDQDPQLPPDTEFIMSSPPWVNAADIDEIVNATQEPFWLSSSWSFIRKVNREMRPVMQSLHRTRLLALQSRPWLPLADREWPLGRRFAAMALPKSTKKASLGLCEDGSQPTLQLSARARLPLQAANEALREHELRVSIYCHDSDRPWRTVYVRERVSVPRSRARPLVAVRVGRLFEDAKTANQDLVLASSWLLGPQAKRATVLLYVSALDWRKKDEGDSRKPEGPQEISELEIIFWHKSVGMLQGLHEVVSSGTDYGDLVLSGGRPLAVTLAGGQGTIAPGRWRVFANWQPATGGPRLQEEVCDFMVFEDVTKVKEADMLRYFRVDIKP
eukprot:gnl/TRDRNA2_/TRDRNA2_141440_c1_seq2.p1 gnl/TRDRNA2_/TRDRNA2_141440_c1~~gnl/TRDRNA2_/TRDRNA2_141440_c1_seq2.p1  ORF type:complete len:454 (+),score=39.96 gnl/TRDRNA2_/TRDRNA2_141440_c1_seq2:101-1363(+)